MHVAVSGKLKSGWGLMKQTAEQVLTRTRIWMDSGRINGREDSEWGLMGVKRTPGTCSQVSCCQVTSLTKQHLLSTGALLLSMS